MRIQRSIVPVAWLMIASVTAHAELLMEESFKIGEDPDAGEYELIDAGGGIYFIAGQTNSVPGFSGAWYVASGTSGRLEETGLEYSQSGVAMTTSGGRLLARNNDSRYGRNLSAPFNASTEGVYYLGFLYKQASTDAGYRVPFALYSGTLRSNDRILTLWMDSSVAGRVNLTVLGETAVLGELGTDVCFMVFRFAMSATSASDSVALYINPPLDEKLELQTPAYTRSGINISFNILGMERWVGTGSGLSHNVYLDEIRMSKNFFEVSTVNPYRPTLIKIR